MLHPSKLTAKNPYSDLLESCKIEKISLLYKSIVKYLPFQKIERNPPVTILEIHMRINCVKKNVPFSIPAEPETRLN